MDAQTESFSIVMRMQTFAYASSALSNNFRFVVLIESNIRLYLMIKRLIDWDCNDELIRGRLVSRFDDFGAIQDAPLRRNTRRGISETAEKRILPA